MKRRPAPKLSGHLHFVTSKTNHGIKLFRNPTLCKVFLETLQELQQKHPFGLHAYVLMPDHFHMILQPQDGRITALMGKIKSVSARRILGQLRESNKQVLLERLKKPRAGKKAHIYQVWQQGFHTVELWNEWFIKKKVDYLHDNPVRAGLVESAKDYPWSSFRLLHGLESVREGFLGPMPW